MFFKDGWEWAKVYFELVGKDRNILWVCGSGRKFWIVGWGWMVLGTGTFWLYGRSFGVYFRLLGMGGHFFMSGWGLMGVFTLFCIFFFKFELELIYKLNFKVCFSLLNLKFVHFKLRLKTNQNQNIIKIKAYSLQYKSIVDLLVWILQIFAEDIQDFFIPQLQGIWLERLML